MPAHALASLVLLTAQVAAPAPPVGGRALGLIGDVDRDGVADYVVVRGEGGGASDAKCAASLRSGRDDAELRRFDIGTLPFSGYAHVCDDLDGDGLGEVLTQFRKLRIHSSADGRLLYERDDARLVGCPGDYDGDGKREVVLSVRAASVKDQRIELRSLSQELPLELPNLSDWAFGAPCGDFDHDGFIDALVRPQGAEGLALVSGRTGKLEWGFDADGLGRPDAAVLSEDRDGDGRGELLAQRVGADKLLFVWSRRIKAAGAKELHALRDSIGRDEPAFAWVGDVDGDHIADFARVVPSYGLCSLAGELLELRTACGAKRAWLTDIGFQAGVFASVDRDADGISEIVSSDVKGGIVVLSGKTGKQLKRYTL